MTEGTHQARPETVVVIFNPIAGGSRGPEAATLAARRLSEAGLTVERVATRDRSGALPIARAWAGRADCVVAVGGDGTVREVVEGLGAMRSRTPIGVVPMGNANVLARELGIPERAADAVDVLVEGHAEPVDLGRARLDGEERIFLAMVGIGWDADTVARLDRFRHTRPGRAAYRLWADGLYAVAGTAAALMPGRTRFSLAVDADSASPATYRSAFLCNLRTYGKGMSVTPDAHHADGLIHVQARRSVFPPLVGVQLAAAVAGRRAPRFVSDYRSGRFVRAVGTAPLSIQVDGDVAPNAEVVEVEVEERAIRIVAPPRGRRG